MANNKLLRIGPVAIPSSAGNLVNPPTLTGGVNVGGSNTFLTLRHMVITNKTNANATVSLYIGLTGATSAGTEFWAIQRTVPANSAIEFGGQLVLEVADFLVGVASAGTTLVFEAEGELGIR